MKGKESARGLVLDGKWRAAPRYKQQTSHRQTPLGIQTSAYDDSTLAGAPNGSLIKGVHIRQLRTRATSGSGTGTSDPKLQPTGATASRIQSRPYDVGHAIDGDPNPLWSAGDFAPRWIQVDLGQLSNISKVRLLVD